MRISLAGAFVGSFLAVCLSVSVASGDGPDEVDDVAAQRLEFMLETVRSLEAAPDRSPDDRWTLHPQPILRWTNPVAGIRDGIVAM